MVCRYTAAVGKVSDLRAWWDKLSQEGPDYGYFPNAKRSERPNEKGLIIITSINTRNELLSRTQRGQGSEEGQKFIIKICFRLSN